MEITITETFKSIGWKDAVASAPKDVVDFALRMSDQGLPTAMGLLRTSQDVEVWAVVCCNTKPYVVYRQVSPTFNV